VSRTIIDASFVSYTTSTGITYTTQVTTPDPPGAVMVFTGQLVTAGTGTATTFTFPHFGYASYTTSGLYLIPASELTPIFGENGRVKSLGVNFSSNAVMTTPTGGQMNL